jgi:mannosyltransferase OCH1-like enzyme
MTSILEQQHAPYFVQKVQVGRDLVGVSRTEFFMRACANHRVLHVGCVDWPITDLAQNLKIKLDGVCSKLDGLYINTEALDAIRQIYKGILFDE